MADIRRSLAYSIADSYLALPLQLVGTMIISRLLTPAETGVFAVAAVFAAFASTFRDFGVAEYLIQEKELSAEKIRAALTVNIVISWAMAALLFCGAPFAADFYRTPGVADVMRVQAFNFILIPFGAVTMAYFRREMDFRPILLANSIAGITSFSVATLAAFFGHGYMSLAWSSLAGVAATVGMSIWLRPKAFPRWPGFKGIGHVINFGKFASGIYIVGQIGKGAPEAIIGRARNMVDVALFSRAGGLVELFGRVILKGVFPVCLPYFAKNQRESGSVVEGYLKSISYLTAVGWPFLAFMCIGSYAAIRLVYGHQWMESVPLSQILCCVAMIELVHCLSKEALMAADDVRASTRLQLINQGIRILALFAVIPFGLYGVGWSLLLASVINMSVTQYALAKTLGLTARSVVRACTPSLLITTATVAPTLAWTLITGISEENYIAFGLLGGIITVGVWLLSVRFFGHPLWGEIQSIVRRFSRQPAKSD